MARNGARPGCERRLDARAQSRAPSRTRLGVVALLGLVLTGAGCIQMAAAWANITGGEWIEPQHKLSKEPLLVLIDDRHGQVSEPRAILEAHKTISTIFLAKNVNDKIVPLEEWRRLTQSEKNYAKLTIRQIGEKLGAANVLYLKVERFALQVDSGTPVFRGEFTVSVKVISTDRKRDVRVWPEGDIGKRVSVGTDPTPMDGDKSAGDVAAELGIKLGKEVALLFYGHRELEK